MLRKMLVLLICCPIVVCAAERSGLQHGLEVLTSDQMTGITGAADTGCNDQCQTAIQTECQIVYGLCTGIHETHYERWCCDNCYALDCESFSMIKYKYDMCIDFPDGSCGGNGNWQYVYMTACD